MQNSERPPDHDDDSEDPQFEQFMAGIRRDAKRLPTPESGAPKDDIVFPDAGTKEYPLGHLGKYRIEGLISSGGFGAVYRALDLELGRLRAIKVLNPGDQKGRLEARLAASISSRSVPHIDEVHDGDADFPQPWIVMELVEGPSLKDLLQVSSRYRETVIIEVGCRIAECLEEIHRRGIVHRDLKPGNLVVELNATKVRKDDTDNSVPDSKGLGLSPSNDSKFWNRVRVCLVDFGMSADAEKDVLQRSGGTPEYMSPEQTLSAMRSRELREIRESSDIFAFGVILYEIATGQRPYQFPEYQSQEERFAARQELFRRIQEDPVPVDHEGWNRLSKDLQAVILKCLEKEPSQRYANGSEVLQELRNIQGSYPIQARPIGSQERIWKWCVRNPWLCTVGFSLTLGILTSTLLAIYASDREAFAIGQQKRAEGLLAVSNLQRDAATGVAVKLATSSGHRLAHEGDLYAAAMSYASALALVAENSEQRQAGSEPLIDNEAFGMVAPAELEGLKKDSEEISPEKQRFLRLRYGLATAAAPRLIQTCFADSAVQYAEFSPDGKLAVLLCSIKGAVRIWDVHRGIPVSPVITLKKYGPLFRARFNPNGKTLLVVGRDDATESHLGLFSVPDGKRLVDDVPVKGAIWSVAFSPDGDKVVTAAGGFGLFTGKFGEAIVRNADDLGESGVRIKHGDWLMNATFSPDGTRIATASTDNAVQVWDASTGTAITAPMLMETPQQVVAFSPDGNKLASAGNFGKARIWNAETGEPITGMLSHGKRNDAPTGPGGAAFASVCFSPNGQALATVCGDQSARLWDAESGEALTQPMTHDDYIVSCQFSSDGRMLLTGSLDGTVRLWDPATGLLAHSQLRHLDQVYSAQFSPVENLVLSAGQDRMARLWQLTPRKPAVPRSGSGTSLFSKDGRFVLEVGDDRSVRLLSPSNLKVVSRPMAVPHAVDGAAFSSMEGTSRMLLTTLLQDGSATLWDWTTGTQVGSPLTPPGIVADLAMSSDGRWCAFVGNAASPYLAVWDSQQQSWVVNSQASPTGFQQVLFSDSAVPKVLAAGLNGSAYLIDLQNPDARPIELSHSGLPVNSACFSPDQKFVLTASSNDFATVWETGSGRKIAELSHPASVTGATFADSRTDLRILTWCEDRRARVWKPNTANGDLKWQEQTALYHTAEVTDADFSRDGQMIATATSDGTVRLWEAQDGSPLSPPLRHTLSGAGMTPSVSLVRFTPDSGQVMSRASLRTWIWDLPFAKGSPEQMKRRTEWTSGRKLADSGDFVPIPPGQLDEYLSMVLEADPDVYPARQWRARNALETGDRHKARTEFEEALRSKRGPSDGQLQYEYGALLQKLEEYERAGDYLTTAIELGHDYRGEAFGSRTYVSLNLNNFEEAIQDSNAAMKLAPFPATHQVPRAVAYASLQRWDEAASDLDEYFRQTKGFMPAQPGLRYQRAILELAREKTETFKKLAGRMLTEMEARPDGEAAYFGTMVCVLIPDAVQREDIQRVIQLAEKAVADNSENADRYSAYGAALLRAGRPREAASQLRSANQIHSQKAKQGEETRMNQLYDLLFLALAEMEIGDKAQAKSLLQQAREAIRQFELNEDNQPMVKFFPWHRQLVCSMLQDEVENRLTAEQ
ncbi:MAG: protein kinase [Planctomycetaceae bacterium]|nr:protein kinase [Planctomycetaceae bacterium]